MTSKPIQTNFYKSRSFLAWPAWLRVVAVLPVLVFLWLAVVWACAEVTL